MPNTDICKMNILLTAATSFEIQPASDFLASKQFSSNKKRVNVLITGVGSIATTYNLGRTIQSGKPDYILQAGLAGSFHNDLLPGSVVYVREELFGDLGAVEDKDFRDVFDLGLISHDEYPFTGRTLKNPNSGLADSYGLTAVRSVTINEITTMKERIELLRNKYQPDIESMEGAACHYVCLREKIPFAQIRGISNYVGERNKENWNIRQAVNNLNKVVIELLMSL